MANASVERFRKLTDLLKQEVHDAAVTQLHIEALDLAQAIQAVVPVHEGTLKTTVHIVPGKKDTIVRIVAGGQKTVRPAISSKPYDYARADEFGTQKMRAKPFFFPSYRLRKKKIISRMKRKITASIKKRSAE
jgi:HK97 gp10 family phage protein